MSERDPGSDQEFLEGLDQDAVQDFLRGLDQDSVSGLGEDADEDFGDELDEDYDHWDDELGARTAKSDSPKAVQLAPSVVAFGRALGEWWSRFIKDDGTHGGTRRLVITRLEAMMALGQDVQVEVMPDGLAVRQVPIFKDQPRGRRLAKHLYGLSMRQLTLETGLVAREFVSFLEDCANEPVGRGLGDYLTQHIPQCLLLEVEESDLPPVPVLPTAPVKPVEELREQVPAPRAREERPKRPVRISVPALEDMFQRLRGDTTQELQDQVVEEIFELVMAVASRPDRDESEMIANTLATEGRRLVDEAKLGTWIRLLSSLHRRVVVEHRLGATRICQQILDFMGSEEHMAAILSQFDLDSENPAPLSLLSMYLTIVPSRALLAVCRQNQWFASQELRTVLLNYLCEAGSSNPEGLCELARDPDPSFADLVVEILPSLPDSVAPRVLKVCFEHVNERIRLDAVEAGRCVKVSALEECLPVLLTDDVAEVRMEAVRALAECSSLAAIAPIIKVVKSFAFREREPEEQVAFWVALASSGRPEALYTVEEALRPRERRGSLSRLLGRLQSDALDMPRRMLVRELAQFDRPQIREILERGARHPHRGMARACREALDGAID